MTMVPRGTSSYQILESEYADFVGSKYAVSVNSGTSALHLALVVLGIGQGDEVIVPDFTMAACGFAVSYTGAKVVTVDCGNDLNIDVTKIEEKITPRTKAIMAVHIYGRLCNMVEINCIAKKHNLFVIEDACEVQGAKVGNADITCFSLFRNKIIAGEEGGILTMNNLDWYREAQFLKNMAFDVGHTYYHSKIGFNYRITDSSADKALASLREYEKNAEKRREVESWYNEIIPDLIKMPARDAVWVYDIIYPNKENVIDSIKGARHFFKPLSSMPPWSQEVGKNAEYYASVGMYLPVNPSMTKKQVSDICSLLEL